MLPIVLFPLQRESMFFRRRAKRRRIFGSPWPAWRSTDAAGDVLVAITGDCAARSYDFLDWAGQHLGGAPAFLVLAGFAGSLCSTLGVGDVIFAERAKSEAGADFAHSLSFLASTNLRRETLLTVDRLIATPADKKQLGVSHSARAVDMEAVMVASACSERGIPFGCLRAVSDDVNAALTPGLFDVLAGGSVSVPRLLSLIVRKPTVIGELLRLRRDTTVAARNLARALEEVLAAARSQRHS